MPANNNYPNNRNRPGYTDMDDDDEQPYPAPPRRTVPPPAPQTPQATGYRMPGSNPAPVVRPANPNPNLNTRSYQPYTPPSAASSSLAPRPYNDYNNRMPVRQPVRRPVAQPPRQANPFAQFGSDSNLKLALMGIGLVVVLAISYLVVSLVLNTWQVWQDDLNYGRPRTTRLEATVGHNEMGGTKSLFIATNIRGQIAIVEMPGGDPTKTRVIVGPHLFGKDKDLVPIKLQIKDVNMDGQPDLLATAADQQLIYINENGNFRPINDQERAKLASANADKESNR